MRSSTKPTTTTVKRTDKTQTQNTKQRPDIQLNPVQFRLRMPKFECKREPSGHFVVDF